MVRTTPVPALLLLFAGFGSGVEEPPDAPLVSTPLGGAVTVMVKFVPTPAGRSTGGQVTTLLESEPPPSVPTKITPPGRLLVARTLVATDGPKLVTLIV